MAYLDVGDIVVTSGESIGVVIAVKAEIWGDEFRVQLVERADSDVYGVGGREYKRTFTGLYHARELCGYGFCENDNEQALILCAAAGIAFHLGARFTGC